MSKIEKGEISMKPKIYFLAGSLFAGIGLAASIVASTFLIALFRFSLRTHGPMGEYRFQELVTNFPWWALILAIVGMVAGIKLLRKYDFSYKHNFLFVVALFIASIILAGFLVDMSGLNDVWFRQGPMRGVMQKYGQIQGAEFKRNRY